MTIKHIYIYSLRKIRVALAYLGVIKILDQHKEKKIIGWLRSLFSIYDFNDFCTLQKPWWVYEATEIVEHFLILREKKSKILEYGSGASTLWLANYASVIYSIEHDKEFYDYLRTQPLDSKIKLYLYNPNRSESGMQSDRKEWKGYDFSAYVNAGDIPNEKFDLIVIDGRCRLDCLAAAYNRLKADGLIVFDNSSRKRYAFGLSKSPLCILRIKGLAPALPYREETSLLGNKNLIEELKEIAQKN